MRARPETSQKPREPYQSPELRTLTFEQAALFLVARAWIGNQAAQHLLRVMFPHD